VTVAAALSPVDAADARDAAMAALAQAGQAVTVEVGDGAVSLCAMQLLIAAQRSAEARGLAVALGPNAKAAFATVEPI